MIPNEATNWIRRPEAKRMIRDVLGFKSLKQVDDFFENIDVVLEMFSDELEVDQETRIAKVKLGSYLTIEKRLKKPKEGWKMPDGSLHNVPEKIVYLAVLNPIGKDLPNVDF